MQYKFTRKFSHEPINLLDITKTRIILGLVLGLLFSFLFYAWVYILREVIRILSVSFNQYLWILTDREMWFYNLFYAFISLILGQSLCFNVWIEKPRPFLECYSYRIKSIVNDQRNLNWYFICWFSKIAFIYALFFGIVFPAAHYVFSFYPGYIGWFILLISVLFLQTWSSVRRVFKMNSLKWMFASYAIISVLSFGLSKIDLVDYHSLNMNYLKHDVYYKFNLQLPESDYCEKLLSPNVENIYVVKSSSNKAQIIIIDKPVLFCDLEKSIKILMEAYGEFATSEVTWRLHIDKDIPMSVVDSVNQALENYGIKNIAYAVLPIKREFDRRYYRDCIISKANVQRISSEAKLNSIEREYSNIIRLRGDESGICFFNNRPVPCDSLKDYIKEQVSKDIQYIVELKVNINDTLKDYSNLYFPVRSAIAELRNDEARKLFGRTFDELNDLKEKNIIKEKFKLRLIEVSDSSALNP